MKPHDPSEIELLDVWNDTGGKMKIKYAGITIEPQKEALEQMRAHGAKTSIVYILCYAFAAYFGEDAEDFLRRADAAGCRPTVIFEAQEDGSLNVKNDGKLAELIDELAGHDD